MKKDKKLFLVIGIIVVVIALVISLVFVFSSNSLKKYDNHMITAQNYISKKDYKKAEASYLAAIKVEPRKAEPYLKLADFYVYNDETDKAISILDQGIKKSWFNNKKKLEDKKAQVINGESVYGNGLQYIVYGDDLYYVAVYHGPNDGVPKIIKQDKNGKEKILHKVKLTKEEIEKSVGTSNASICIVNGRLYYMSSFELVSFDLNGKDKKYYDIDKLWGESSKFDGSVTLLNIKNNQIVINLITDDDGMIYSIDTLTQKEKLIKKHAISGATLSDELYYFDTAKGSTSHMVIGCYNLSTLNDKEITTINTDIFLEELAYPSNEDLPKYYGCIEKLNDSICFSCFGEYAGIGCGYRWYFAHMNMDGSDLTVDWADYNWFSHAGLRTIDGEIEYKKVRMQFYSSTGSLGGYEILANKYFITDEDEGVCTCFNRETDEKLFSLNLCKVAGYKKEDYGVRCEDYDGRYIYFVIYGDDFGHYQYDTKTKTVKLIWRE